MKAIERVRRNIANIPEGKPFVASVLRECASTVNIRQILNRLVKARKLKRVSRGIYIKPKYLSQVGEVLPSVSEVAETLAKSTGETIVPHGAEAARQLQLTTQVPMHVVFYTSGNTRTLKVANRTIKLKHVNPSQLIAPGTTAGLIISALKYMGREHVTQQTIETVKHHITATEFKTIFKLIHQMPAWMSDMFYRYKKRSDNE